MSIHRKQKEICENIFMYNTIRFERNIGKSQGEFKKIRSIHDIIKKNTRKNTHVAQWILKIAKKRIITTVASSEQI